MELMGNLIHPSCLVDLQHENPHGLCAVRWQTPGTFPAVFPFAPCGSAHFFHGAVTLWPLWLASPMKSGAMMWETANATTTTWGNGLEV